MDTLFYYKNHKSEGYIVKKFKTFSPEEIRTFIDEAPDNQFLFTKIISNQDRRVGQCESFTGTLIVNIVETKTKIQRTFTIMGNYYDICKKYINLRPEVCATPSFFEIIIMENVQFKMQANCEIFKPFRCKFIYRTLLKKSKNFCNCISRCWWRYYCAKRHGGCKSTTVVAGHYY
ncbi:hypothetical protein NQ318_005980 [Aromia moschata]|uniref:Uncharacterized protein n=1 Tax=Aromia moschata TaxID=1265417 RepID=A0AAV8XZZ5_9CUCU|nr:hypothetical protein NQ318_005980 [Aromia moschata]